MVSSRDALFEGKVSHAVLPALFVELLAARASLGWPIPAGRVSLWVSRIMFTILDSEECLEKK
jgi:hypothetical protein